MNNTTVTSVGNSWVVCRSKSHAGHIYYFNTLTGQSVWNLSEVEKEKANSRFQENHNDYPEPSEPPSGVVPSSAINKTEQTQTEAALPTKVYNKQVINNQFAEHRFPLSQFITPQLIATPMALSNTSFNPNIWAIPPTVLIQAASRYEGQPQNCNVMYNNHNPEISVQNTTIPLTKRFVNFNNSNTNSCQKNRIINHPTQYRTMKFITNNKTRNTNVAKNYINKKKFNSSVGYNYNPSKQCKSGYKVPKNDLRNLLMSKRNKSVECNKKVNFQMNTYDEPNKNIANRESLDANDEYNYESKVENTPTFFKETGYNKTLTVSKNEVVDEAVKEVKNVKECREDYCSDVDSDWLEDNIRVSGGKLELDISSLKSLADPNLNAGSWYIAVDTNILLGHLNFMNVLLNSDEELKLMVPRDVLSALKEQADDPKCRPRDSRRARRAIAFISQHLDANTAIIGETCTDGSNEDYPYLLDCCINLADENYFVVLLSNDVELEEFKPTTDIPIFNIKQLKHFLSNDMHADVPSRPVIVVQNDEAANTDESAFSKVDSESYCESIESADNKSRVSDKTDSTQEFKHTVDAVVQTDFVSTEIQQKIPTGTDFDKKLNESSSRNLNDTNMSSDTNKTVEPNTRKIRLKRNTAAIVTPLCSTIDKKQFKWRRKRNVSCTQTSGFHDNLSSSENNENSCSSKAADGEEHITEQSNDVAVSNILENSSETNSSIIIQRMSLGKVIIDESSTSAVSNTASNVDSEVDCDLRYKSTSTAHVRSPEREATGNIFDITDSNMQAHLESRRDEWTSRFVQIMEDILTQVLQKDITPNIFPPPWSIQEATICVKVKFGDEKYIYDAAVKFLNILNRVSDNRGRWKQDMRPKEFMELYRYGVYLVKSLKLKLIDFEDLQIALDSLHNLLSDVRNPNLEASYNDNFESFDEACPNEASNSNRLSSESKVSIHHNVDSESQTSYGKRYTSVPKKHNYTFLCGEDENVTKEKTDSNHSNSSAPSTNNKVEPIIIRNFTVFPEYEKKIIKNSSSNFDDSNASNDDYCFDEELSNVASKQSCERSDIIRQKDSDSSNRCPFKTKTNYPVKDVSEMNLNLIYENTIDEIKETFKQVFLFCEHSQDELRNTDKRSTKTTQIQEKAIEALNCIETLTKLLNDIVCKDSYYFENMQTQFTPDSIKVTNADVKQIENYRNKIANMIEQAKVLQESVNIIVQVSSC